MSNFILTVDGPSGSGKSTLCKILAKNDCFIHIDSGKIYRAISYLLDVNFKQSTLNNLKLDFKLENSQILLIYNNIILNELLADEEIAKKASLIAQKPFIREYVNNFIRRIAHHGRFVIDGRDAGSVIFKDANLKFFLTADVIERAKRRSKELNTDYNQSYKALVSRDEQDTQRKIAPLIVPQGAIIIDTTFLSIEEVYNKIKSYI
ncbi:(d)CMP kinase [Desulfurella sp.]|uniref:(d)CMP kinase n=1 Tax=Desulfurella sp. TaxID=1962857 RepID=UPI003D0E0426